MRNVADGTSVGAAWSVCMPQRHTNRNEQNRRKSSPEGYSMEPRSVLIAVGHIASRGLYLQNIPFASDHLVKHGADDTS